MSRLDLAATRLEAALERLENGRQPVRDDEPQAARMAELEAERDRLLARIAALEDEMATLTTITEEVEERLDGAIGEFRAAVSR